MPLDSDSLGSPSHRSLGERSSGGGGRKILYKCRGRRGRGCRAGLWWWLGAKTIEVTTITAEADSTGPSLATPC